MDSTALFLVIDDEIDLLEGMARILQRDGHRVITASTGAEGVRLAQEQKPDFAIIDVQLPDINGLEVCKQIQAGAQPGNIDTILISSAVTSAEDQVKGFQEGVCEYLCRPLPNKEFLARVNARLKDKQIRELLELDRLNAKKISDNEQSQRIELEEELQAIFSTAPICLFLTDGNAKVLKANPALSETFGIEMQSIIGAACGIAFDCLHNNDHTAGCGHSSHCKNCGIRNAIIDSFSTGASHKHVESYLTCMQQDQTVERIVRFSTCRVTVSGKKRVFVCLEDITKRKKSSLALQKSEELFRRTFDQSPIGAAMVGLDYRFLRVNKELCRITGYDAKELLDLSFTDITFKEDLQLDLTQAKELTNGLIDQYEMDKRYVRKDGTLIWGRLSVRLIRDSDNNPLYFLPMVVDIDNQKKLVEEKDLQLQLFRIAEENCDLKTTVENVLSFLKTWSGVDAIGMRLRQGNDYPYYKTIGFPEEFIECENSLFNLDHSHDQFVGHGYEVSPECMCGYIINGILDSSLPFITNRGSFSTNSTSKLLRQNNVSQMPHGIRKHCNDAGYESVLLIPLRVGGNTLGLIQLNHKKEDYLTQTFILLMERLVGHIAVIISKLLADEKLKIKQNELEEINTTLKIILKNREQELDEHNQEILMNVCQLVLPCIDRLKLSNLDIRQKSQLEILENNLQTITSPFSKKLSSDSIALTPSLIQVSDMIKKGLRNKEIAKLMGISVQSVETYRKRIRARLKLKNSKVNLRAYLMRMDDWDI